MKVEATGSSEGSGFLFKYKPHAGIGVPTGVIVVFERRRLSEKDDQIFTEALKKIRWLPLWD
jgi:hypothetical protein